MMLPFFLTHIFFYCVYNIDPNMFDGTINDADKVTMRLVDPLKSPKGYSRPVLDEMVVVQEYQKTVMEIERLMYEKGA